MDTDPDETAVLRDALTNFANAMMRQGFREAASVPLEGSTVLRWTGLTFVLQWGTGDGDNSTAHSDLRTMSDSELVRAAAHLEALYEAAQVAMKRRQEPVREATEKVRATATKLGLSL